MAAHKFGIMQTNPEKGKKYVCYEPDKYNCISVHDDYILPLSEKMNEVKCYWGTLDRPQFGLSYYGTTIIPPESLDSIIELVWNNKYLSELFALLAEAQRDNKYVIHFGI